MITNTLPVTFFPLGTCVVNATDAGQNATLLTTSNGVGTNVVVFNEGPDLGFVMVGPSGLTPDVPNSAGTGMMPVPVGFYGLTISRDANLGTTAYARCNTGGTAKLYFTVGNGT